MIDGPAYMLTAVAAVGAGLVAGVFFAFSTFVMRALGRLPTAQAIAAMQAINVAAPALLFMLALFGTAVVCVVLMVSALADWGDPAATHQLVGGALYLLAIVLTAGYHVPRNNALARLEPSDEGAAQEWARYLAGWTAWNHLRTLGSLAAAVAFTLAVRGG
jgi:uncharacterized membrane protein